MNFGSIRKGETKSESTTLQALISSFQPLEKWFGYYTTFEVLETTNLFAELDGLPEGLDLDLYLGELNPATNQPDFWRGTNNLILYNSSTNPGNLGESIFAQLNEGNYWLGVKSNRPEILTDNSDGNYEDIYRDATFQLTLDGNIFDQNTILSDDPLLNKQWHLFNTGTPQETDQRTKWTTAPNVDIAAPEAWKLAHDASEIIVAVIDGGFNINHPDLISNLWRNPSEIAGNDNDDDDNQLKDDIHGWNFAASTPELPLDTDGHGTHVAGIIGAQGNNNIGVSGVAWDTQMMFLDVFNGERAGRDEPIAEAIAYAVDNGAKVINLSLGSKYKYSTKELGILFDDSEYQEVLQKAYDQDVFIAIAAGNDGSEYENKNQWNGVGNMDVSSTIPSDFSNSFGNIASVGSTNAENVRSSYSNYGKSISISAPGGDSSNVRVGTSENGTPLFANVGGTQIYSTLSTTLDEEMEYGPMVGTSMAAPIISGMAALIRAQNENISAPETLAILRAGAQRNQRLKTDVNQGYQANLYSSLTLAQAWEGPDTITSIGQDLAPVINLTALTTPQTITGKLTLSRDAEDDVLIGFYQVLDTDGTVLDALGNPVRPGDEGYQSEALSSGNLINNLNNLALENDTSQSQDYALAGSLNGVYLAPYAITGDNTWFAWSEANSDGLDHFKVLGANRFGLEDQSGLDSDQDFNDIVMSFASEQIL